MATFGVGVAVPIETARAVRASFTPEEVTTATTIIAAWRKAGPQPSLAAAVTAKVQVGDGQPYANVKEARKAAGHVMSLIRRTLGMDDTSGTVHVVTGAHPTAANAVSWGMYFGPYVAPVKREKKAPATV